MSTREDDRPGESFLGRWSRLKQQTRAEEDAAPAPARPAQEQPKADLPPVESLDLASDFTGFMRPGVHQDLRRLALRKLFSDPRFNVMDGLDVYIDDFGKPDPIPDAMLRSLSHAARALGITPDDAKVASAAPQQVMASAPRGGDLEQSASAGEGSAGENALAQAEASDPEAPAPPGGQPLQLDSLSHPDAECEKVDRYRDAT